MFCFKILSDYTTLAYLWSSSHNVWNRHKCERSVVGKCSKVVYVVELLLFELPPNKFWRKADVTEPTYQTSSTVYPSLPIFMETQIRANNAPAPPPPTHKRDFQEKDGSDFLKTLQHPLVNAIHRLHFSGTALDWIVLNAFQNCFRLQIPIVIVVSSVRIRV